MNKLKRMLASAAVVCTIGLVGLSGWTAAYGAAPETRQIMLYPGQTTVYINGIKQQAEAMALKHEDRYFLPAAELPRWLDVPVSWDADRGVVQVAAPAALLSFELAARNVSVNGEERPWEEHVRLEADRLYVELDWLAQYISFQSRTDEKMGRIELRYMVAGEKGMFRNDAMPRVKPVAKFTVDKEAYRIGEPIRYSSVSYDPKGGAIVKEEWIGNAEAIFTPGLYKVSLTVTDSAGNVSDTFSRNVLVKNEPYLDDFEYGIYHKPVGTYVRETEEVLRARLRGLPELVYEKRVPAEDRPLIVSDSPETFTERGALYSERVNGKARLYATHVNGMDRKMKFAIAVTNPYGDRSVTIRTTNQGEVYPSIYANLIGNEATLEFLLDNHEPETMVLGPLETAYYKVMPDFFPGQGMNVMYDVETDGDVYFTFAAMNPEETPEAIGKLPRLPFSGNVRGTFTSSDVVWELDGSKLDKPSSFAIGDGVIDQFVTGTDFYLREPALNLGNYGVVYRIAVRNPQPMAVLVLARGGPFKGPFKIDGNIVQTPSSGVMMDYQGYTIIARTDGTEPLLDIDFSPASGSAFPIDVIFYPLKDLK